MGNASSTLTATPSMEAKKEEAADALNAAKAVANGVSMSTPSLIPGPSHSYSYAKPRRYISNLKKDVSTRNCSNGSITPRSGPPNDDSGIGMDNSTTDSVSFDG